MPHSPLEHASDRPVGENRRPATVASTDRPVPKAADAISREADEAAMDRLHVLAAFSRQSQADALDEMSARAHDQQQA